MPKDTLQIEDLDLEETNKGKFDREKFVETNKLVFALGLIGIILVGVGVFLFKDGLFTKSDSIEIIENATTEGVENEVVVEIAGAIEKPGVYKLKEGSRVEDLLIAAGGISSNADRDWVDKTINRSAKLSDGTKIYIPSEDEQTLGATAKNGGGVQTVSGGESGQTGGLININTASLNELDTLPGIGPVYAQSIVEHRPYSSVEELTSKGALKKNVYEKVKDKVTVY